MQKSREPFNFKILRLVIISAFSVFIVTSTETLANAISQYETLLSELEQSINSKDGLKSRNAISELKKMKTEMPPNLIFKELKDSNKKIEFKYILADFLDYSTKYVSSKVFNDTLDSYIEIIKNPNYNSTIRRHMISAVTKGYAKHKKTQLQNLESDQAFLPVLREIINNKNDDPEVVAKAIYAVSELEYKGLDSKLLNIISNWKKEDSFIVRGTCLYFGRAKDQRAIPNLIEIINSTDNEELFITAVYSISLTGSPEMVEPILNNYNRFGSMGRSSCKSAMGKNRQLFGDKKIN